MSAEYIQEFFQPDFSPPGSNQRAIEEVLVFNWVSFIQDTAGLYTHVHYDCTYVVMVNIPPCSPMEVGRKARGSGM